MTDVRVVASADGDVRAAVLVAPSRIELQTFPRPEVDATSGLLLVEANGICGTDVHWRAGDANLPRILGHEVVGRIVEIGETAAQRWGVQVGDRVAVEAGIACGTCADCAAGFSQTCAVNRSYGSNITTDVPPALWGGLAEFMYLAPGSSMTVIDPEVSADVAAGWFSPLANGVDWTGPVGADVQPGHTVVILGPGPQGLASCLAAKARGAATVVLVGLARDRGRLAAGRTLGADHLVVADEQPVLDAVRELTDGALAHTVIDTSGSTASASIAPHLLRRRGVVAAASPINAADGVDLPLAHMIWNQIRWRGVLSNRPAATAGARDLLRTHAYQLTSLVTHTFALDAVDAAIDMVAGQQGHGVIKVVVRPNERCEP
jgi:threonine dehydrogenase-like Zn-dependent dehydrogenase